MQLAESPPEVVRQTPNELNLNVDDGVDGVNVHHRDVFLQVRNCIVVENVVLQHAMPFRWVQTRSQEFMKSQFLRLLVHASSLGNVAVQNIC